MNKVIFICLLSLSTCLSRPDATQQAPQDSSGANNKTTIENGTVTLGKPEPSPTPVNNNNTALNTSISANNITKDNSTTTPGNNTKPEPNAHIPEPPKGEIPDQTKPTNGTVPKPPGSNTTNSSADNGKTNKTEGNTDPAPKPDLKPVPAPIKPSNKTEPANKTGPANKTEPVKENVVPVQARGFDGGSFIGGIILTLGLLAIGFMGYKYYKNQTERNYHTL